MTSTPAARSSAGPVPSGASDAPPPVLVETLLLRHDAAEGFAYRRLITALGRGARPDGAARRLAGLSEGDERHLVHSTSWRATDDGSIVLTYLVHPDPAPGLPATPLPDPRALACSPKAGHPSPPDLKPHHVAAHAVRHLAFLARTDPVVAAHLASPGGPRKPPGGAFDRALGGALDGLPGSAAGQLRRVQGS
ncbi:hypothetical protein [Streptomyces sp. 4R-3d]|uniref:hypothetical protein n=1 Tax=Streptomyces sp. 4R-3d TaxID=2559605 RepID=UPI001072FA65|nr:hypothetical protein [Streptomyces sp. 4R-3d]TFI19918.1 hypothetical protein E4P36_38200 [Streptomyces sp. 4R-3d]